MKKLELNQMENLEGGIWGSREWCLTGAILGAAACIGTFNPLGVAASAAWALSC